MELKVVLYSLRASDFRKECSGWGGVNPPPSLPFHTYDYYLTFSLEIKHFCSLMNLCPFYTEVYVNVLSLVHEDVCVYKVQLHSESEMPLAAFHNAQLSPPSQGFLSVVDPKYHRSFVSKCIPAAWLNSAAAAKSLQLWPTLCDPIDGSPPGSPVPGILQARTLEWLAISFSNA